MSVSNIPYPQLTGTNFSNWKFRLDNLLSKEGVNHAVLIEPDDVLKMSATEKASYESMDKKAKCIIVQCITDRHLEFIKDSKTSYEMMTSLTNVFERKSPFSKLYVMKKLFKLKCTTSDLQDHFVEVDTLLRELEAAGANLDETDKVCYLLLTMPEKYDLVITAIETMTEKAKVNLEFVKGRLLDAELKFKESGQINFKRDCAFSISSGCYECGSMNHFKKDCPKVSNVRKSNVGRTNFYRGSSRRMRNGRYRRYASPSRTSQPQANINAVFPTERQEVSFIANENNEDIMAFFSGESEEISFVLDSGATDHLVAESVSKNMYDIVEIEPVNIKIANGKTLQAKSRGKLRVSDNKTVLTIEAMIVKNLGFNLISAGKIMKKGYKIIFENDRAQVVKNNSVIMCFNQYCNLFVNNFKFEQVSYNMSCTSEEVWHKRLGHVNYESMKKLDLPKIKEVCGPCMEGKAKRLPFKTVEYKKSSRKGELLHTDLCGPVKHEGLNGEKYFQTIIDDYSHYTVVYLLKNKGEASENLMDHIRKLKADGNLCSRIRCDGGGEYVSNALKNFCKQKGITLEYSLPYTSQQNGVSERANQTLLNKARTMFTETKLPKFLWGEAVRTAAYQMNRSPTTAIQNAVPAEVYLGRVDYRRLKVFGARAWAYKLPKPNDKLEPRAIETRMVGYGINGYRLWNPIDNKIIISRDVRFDETDFVYREDTPMIVGTEISAEKEQSNEENESQHESSEEENDSKSQQEENRLEKRKINLPSKYKDYEMNFVAALSCGQLASELPTTFDQAVEEGWELAIKEELLNHKKNNTWEIVPTPKDEKLIESRWIFTKKTINNEEVKKARLVAKGYMQEMTEDILYAPVARMATVRVLMVYALERQMKIHQMDVKAAFLNGVLSKPVFMKIPEGLDNISKRSVCKLNKSLYGLRSSPKDWNNCLNQHLLDNGFFRSKVDPCLCHKNNCYVLIWVDDIILISDNNQEISEIKNMFRSKFEMTDLTNEDKIKFLGINIEMTKDNIYFSQRDLIEKVLSKFGMTDCKQKSVPIQEGLKLNNTSDKENNCWNIPYKELIGSLMYIMLGSRPDICFAITYFSQFQQNFTKAHFNNLKNVLSYLKGTIDLKLKFTKTNYGKLDLNCYVDADFGSNMYDRKSITGYVIKLNNNLIMWKAKKQSIVALSSAEAEYVALSQCITECIFLKQLLENSFNNKIEQIVAFEDNQSAIKMACTAETKRSKHIDIKHHFLKNLVEDGSLKIEYVPSKNQQADIMTKPLNKTKFVYLRDMLGLI